ncbi:Regulatory protein Spx [compost metagenome]
MTVTIYTKKGCSTCTEARAYLVKQGVSFVERELFKDPLTEAEIRELLGDRPASELVSTRSPRYKAMGLDVQTMSNDDCLRVMAQEPYLIRRPTFKLGDDLVIGMDTQRLEALISQA